MRQMMITLVRYGLWPGLLALCLSTTIYGVLNDSGFLLFNIAYFGLAIVLFFAERALPFERSWLKNDGQISVDLAHTALSKGVAQVLIVVGAVFGLAEFFAESGLNIWPTEWPLIAQVILGLIIIEAGLYAAHRLSHEVPLFWRFHAVHHSTTRLSFINTGRFHFVDTAVSIALSQPLLFLAGAPIEVFKLTSATTAFIGMLTHCNVDMRFGLLSYVFNTPTLHRFHHSKDLREGNKNYGENLVLFDLIFGTYYNAPYRPPTEIGIDGVMPRNFLGQLAHPFRSERKDSVAPSDVSPAS